MKHYKEQNAREAWTGIWFIRGGKQRKKDNYIGRPVRCHWKYFRWNIIIVAPRHGHRSFLLKYVCCCRISWIDEKCVNIRVFQYFELQLHPGPSGDTSSREPVTQPEILFLSACLWMTFISSYWEREPIVFTVKTATAQIDGQFNYQSNERSLIMKFWNFFFSKILYLITETFECSDRG